MQRRIDTLSPAICLTLFSTIWVKSDGLLLIIAVGVYASLTLGVLIFAAISRKPENKANENSMGKVSTYRTKMDFDYATQDVSLPRFNSGNLHKTDENST